MKKRPFSIKKQSGVVLAVSLIILVLITMLVLTSSKVINLEEKMAGNAKHHNLAFQAAEDALRGGEDRIEAATSLDEFNGNNGLLGENNLIPDYLATDFWAGSANNSIEFNTNNSEVDQQPRYFIKFIEENTDDNGNIGDSGPPTAYFMVISRGTGGKNSDSQALLRSYYGKRF
jgi:type IV pilus assembly protein PilX